MFVQNGMKFIWKEIGLCLGQILEEVITLFCAYDFFSVFAHMRNIFDYFSLD